MTTDEGQPSLATRERTGTSTCPSRSSLAVSVVISSYRRQHDTVRVVTLPFTDGLEFCFFFALSFRFCAFQAAGPHAEWCVTGFIVPSSQHQTCK